MFANKRLSWIVITAALLVGIFSITAAQDTPTTITLAVPESLQTVFRTALDRFESENPGIAVQLVAAQNASSPTASADLESALQSAAVTAQQADVVLVSRFDLRPTFTRAGYFLDMKPLADSDPAFNRDDFYPALRTAFEWDGGLWALPVIADSIVLVYNPAAFDGAGLTYPDGSWTIEQFANAARALTTTEGETTRPGLWVNTFFLPIFFSTLLGQDFADTNAIPNAPDFATPELAALMTTWNDLVAEGVAITDYVEGAENTPLQVSGTYLLSPESNSQNRDNLPKAALLPGNKAGLEAFGLAISAGTTQPQVAYNLIKFLSGAQEMNAILAGGTLARQTLTGDNSVGGRLTYPPESQAVLDGARNRGFSNVSLLYQDEIIAAYNAVRGGQDPLEALTVAQTQAADTLATAVASRGNTLVVVATPIPEIVVAADEVALNFAMWNNTTSLPNRDAWDRVIQEFVAADPQVASIQFNYITPTSATWRDGIEQANDCMFAPGNEIGFTDLSLRLPLDPLLSADPNFDPNDMLNGAMAQVQSEGQTWALPISVMPYVLRYDPAALAGAGITVPPEGWTINQFVDALNVIEPLVGDVPAFYTFDPNGTNLLMLVAAFGALPLDPRTDPPTVDFTSPATVDAIRQALDLAKNKTMNYEEMARAMRSFTLNPPEDARAIYGDSLNFVDDSSRTALTPFPHGDLYTPLTYEVSTAFISATAQNPEACYRWISTIAQHPELFTGMPARRSLIGSEALLAAQGASNVATYQQVEAALSSPETVVFSSGNLISRLWLLRAFDRYVLQNADLQTELAAAETFTKDYLACVGAIPPDAPAFPTKRDDCAVTVDPTVAANVGR
jgi:ABC-type glycerol-3-phosphate transport system substrate-binding protein